ncbi:MAG: portal protein [Aeromonas popoffii]|uniref:portal protein n=1 Tax=Aeromonas popoffii TaxID=70856 RepID=UPI003F3BED0B
MANKVIKMLTESFMGGIFGASSQVPWEGPDTQDSKVGVKTQIATDADGTETYIMGGGSLSAITPNSEANAKEVATKIQTYRNMQYYVEVDEAIENVVNDVISSDPDESPISVNLDRLELSDATKEKIRAAHDKIMRLLDLNESAYEIVRQYYIDGRRGYQIIMDENPSKGIKKLVCLDSCSIRPVKLVEVEQRDGMEFIKTERRAFLYNSAASSQSGVGTWVLNANQNRILELPYDSVAYVDSGLYSNDGKTSVGYLEAAVKPANNLRTVEDATVIYAITRAIDKRAFYLDCGDLPKKSAEEYMVKMMNKFKTKLNYNPGTGEIDQNKAAISMIEDLWLPRRDGQNATEIQNLEAGKNLGEINHVQYMKEKLYAGLKIPKGRIGNDSMINIGGSELAQVTRDEWKFSKHITRIRKRFSGILKQSMKIELISTKVMSEDEWAEYCDMINYDFAGDSYIKEQQEAETMTSRINVMKEAEAYVGKIWSIASVKRKILRMTDEEIKEEEALIAKEKASGAYEDYGTSPLTMKSQEEMPEEFGAPPPEQPGGFGGEEEVKEPEA